MRGNRAFMVPPTEADLKEAIRNLDYNVQMGVGNSIRLDMDNAITLLRYIHYLEEQLASLTEHYQGVPTEYFNYVRKEQLQVKYLGVTPPWSLTDTETTGSTSSRLFSTSSVKDPQRS